MLLISASGAACKIGRSKLYVRRLPLQFVTDLGSLQKSSHFRRHQKLKNWRKFYLFIFLILFWSLCPWLKKKLRTNNWVNVWLAVWLRPRTHKDWEVRNLARNTDLNTPPNTSKAETSVWVKFVENFICNLWPLPRSSFLHSQTYIMNSSKTRQTEQPERLKQNPGATRMEACLILPSTCRKAI